MQKEFIWSVSVTIFLRLQIYEANAAFSGNLPVMFFFEHLTFHPKKRDEQVKPRGHKVLLEPERSCLTVCREFDPFPLMPAQQ